MKALIAILLESTTHIMHICHVDLKIETLEYVFRVSATTQIIFYKL